MNPKNYTPNTGDHWKLGLVIILLLLSGCQKPVDLNVGDGVLDGVAINARVFRDVTGGAFLDFELTSFNPDNEQTVQSVTIIREEPPLQQSIAFGGVTRADTLLPRAFIEFGSRYQMILETEQGLTFESDFQSILMSPSSASINAEIVEREVVDEMLGASVEDHLSYRINMPLVNGLGDRVSLRWQAEEVFLLIDLGVPGIPFAENPVRNCWLNSVPIDRGAILLNSSRVAGESLNDFILFEDIPDYRHASEYNLVLTQETLSQEAAIYFQQISELEEIEGGLFDPPFANPISNIRATNSDMRTFGYFYATDLQVLRFHVSAATAGFPPSRCSIFDSFDDADQLCRSCEFDPRVVALGLPPEFFVFENE